MDGETVQEKSDELEGRPAPLQYSNTQPVWHYVLLSIFTFTIYDIFWFYRNWKHLKAHKKSDVSPGWRTIGLFVPLLNLVLIYWQFSDIRDYAKQVGCKKQYSSGWLLFGYFVLRMLWKLPNFWWLLTFLSVCPLATVQETLNEFWRKEQPGFVERKMFKGWEFALLFAGTIAWLLVFIVIFRT